MGNKKQYLLDYMQQKKDYWFTQGEVNIVRTPCGSGKTYLCMDIICNPNNRYSMNKCLYVTDTRALADSVRLDYEKRTGLVASQWNWNLNVITYQTLANIVKDQRDVNNLDDYLQQYDYIFLDEVHQLFIYSRNYDAQKTDEDNAEYKEVIKSLKAMSEQTCLVCLSATPQPLIAHFKNLHMLEFINEVIPIEDIHKIKSYRTDNTIEVINMQDVAYKFTLQENEKLYVFAQTIAELKNYERIFKDKGYSTLALWNDKKYQQDGNKHKLTKYQLEARKHLLETGEFKEQVLLLNGAYESGINIEHMPSSKQETIYVMVAHCDAIKITQARGRIRHNIDTLFHTLDIDSVEYTNWQGIEANEDLCQRLEELITLTEDSPYLFRGKEGLAKIAEHVDLWIKLKNGISRKCTTIKALNEQLEVRALPYRIQQSKKGYYKEGKRLNFNYYTVIFIEDEEEEE